MTDQYAEFVLPRLQNAQRILGFDIETDTRGEPFRYPNDTESKHPAGLDPRVSQITTVGIVSDDGETFQVDGDDQNLEQARLSSVVAYLDHFFLGVHIVTWNGTYFDGPFIKVRDRSGLPLTFNYLPQFNIAPKYGPSEWFPLVSPHDWNSFRIGNFTTLDLAPLWKPYCEATGVKHSLKPVCEAMGIEMISVDAAKMESLTAAERRAYNLSDAGGTAQLGVVSRELDRIMAEL